MVNISGFASTSVFKHVYGWRDFLGFVDNSQDFEIILNQIDSHWSDFMELEIWEHLKIFL